jgi:cytochrome c-type biogenesis protein CcmH
MNSKKKIYMIVMMVVTLFLFRTSPAFPVTVGEIAQELTCTCGCNMLVSACEGTMECGAAAGIKDQIVTKLNSGQSKEEIIAFFVNQYGEKILSAPTKQGFNLTAWILPFAAVIIGIGVVYSLLKSWASRRRPMHEPTTLREVDQGYLETVERELKTFDT